VRRPTLRDRMRYRFDTLVSRGTTALIVCLWLASVLLIMAVAAFVIGMGVAPLDSSGRPRAFAEVAWMCLMRTLDPGTMGQDAGPWTFLLAMLFITTCGIFIGGTLIGLLTAGIEQRLQEMRKGRSQVVEFGHVVVLGWSEQVFVVLRELLWANESDPGFRAAVLADLDKVEMEDEVRRRLDRRDVQKVVCRTGDPTDLKDLQIVNADAARAVAVLPADSADREARTLQAVMALSATGQSGSRYIVTETSRPETQQLLEQVAGGDIVVVESLDLVAGLAAQTCRQPGLAAVYQDLLDFEGNEIYIGHARDVSGSTFGDALLAFADAIPIGVRRATGAMELNPAMTSRLADGDALIAIATGPSDVRFTGFQRHISDATVIASRWSHVPRERRAERTLLLGWNDWSGRLLRHLDRFVPAGSSVVVISEQPLEEAVLSEAIAGLEHLSVDARVGSASDRRRLEALAQEGFDHALVVSDVRRMNPDAADARSLVILLHLREIAARSAQRFSVTSEILIEKNREVLLAAGVDDLISSAQVSSLMITQVIQNREISRVFEAIFHPAGSEFYLKPAENYVNLGVPVDFYSVIVAAREHSEIAVGYRLAHHREAPVLNPVKTDRVVFQPGDRLVVLAED